MLLLTISDSYIILASRRGVIITCPIQSLYSERKMAMFSVTIDNIIEATADRKPDFSNLLKVLHRETPDRPTLFEFFLNPVLEQKFSRLAEPPKNEQEYHASHVEAFRAAGYDYVTSLASSFGPFSRYVVMSQAPSVSPNSGLAWRVAVLDGLPYLAKDTFIF